MSPAELHTRRGYAASRANEPRYRFCCKVGGGLTKRCGRGQAWPLVQGIVSAARSAARPGRREGVRADATKTEVCDTRGVYTSRIYTYNRMHIWMGRRAGHHGRPLTPDQLHPSSGYTGWREP